MDFYYLPASSTCRAVQMVAREVGVELNKKLTNLSTGDHRKPEFIKINPQHMIPTIVDNGFSLWESRAIMVYLVEKYGKDDSLYPKDPKEQALINQRLYFDMGTLYKSFSDYYYPQFMQKLPGDPEMLEKIKTAFGFLNTFLEGNQFVAGDKRTLADLTILATVSTFVAAEFDISPYSNVTRWYETVQKLTPGWDEGLTEMKEFVENGRT